MKIESVTHQFVEFAPREVAAGVLYISIQFDTVVHLCCCGCGNKVALPLSPAGWSLTYNGSTISLTPSIGNSSLPCRSHYWIRNGQVHWHPPMTQAQSDRARARDRADQCHMEDERTPGRGGVGWVRAIWEPIVRQIDKRR